MDKTQDRIALLILVLALGVAYALCQNGTWLPGGGDDAFYTDIGRSIASEGDFAANGVPVVLVPPGWPMMLAGGMKISTSYALLNLIPMACLLIAAALWYRILRRFAGRWTAFWVMLGVGMMFQWQRLSFHLYSDAPCIAMLAGATLLGLQINEGKRWWWRAGAIAALGAGMVMVRWAGLAGWVVIAGALLMRERRPGWNRLWVTAALAGLVMAGTFVALRVWMMEGIEKRLGSPAGAAEVARAKEASEQDNRRISTVLKIREVFSEQAVRTAGNWMTRMLWPPTEAGESARGLTRTTAVIGWGILLAVMVGAWQGARRTVWIWAGVMIFYLGMSFGWRATSPRHVMPVTPMLLLGFWQGGLAIREWFGGAGMKRLVMAGVLVVVISAGATNAAIYAMNAWIIRTDCVHEWEAGEYEQLLGVAQRINENPSPGEYIAVNASYTNVDRTFWHPYMVRMMVLTTGLKARVAPLSICEGEPNEKLAEWCRAEGIRYYVYRPPVNPWRMWHIRMPWLQRMVKGKEPGPANPFYVLYKLTDKGFERVEPAEVKDGLRRVPPIRTGDEKCDCC